jgi:hypothetical protein
MHFVLYFSFFFFDTLYLSIFQLIGDNTGTLHILDQTQVEITNISSIGDNTIHVYKGGTLKLPDNSTLPTNTYLISYGYIEWVNVILPSISACQLKGTFNMSSISIFGVATLVCIPFFLSFFFFVCSYIIMRVIYFRHCFF